MPDDHDAHDHDAAEPEGGGHAGHSHGIPRDVSGGRAFAVGIGLNTLFTVIEALYGLASHSMALVADAAHNLSDVLGLILAWGAVWLARRTPTGRRTYGFRRSTILAALANGLLLVGAVGAVAWEAIGRFREPAPVQGQTVIVVAGIGVLINSFSAALFARGQKGDVNVRGAFLHLAADAGVSLAVVVAGFILVKTGWQWVDPAISLLVSAVVLWSTWGLLREATSLAMDAVPGHIQIDEVKAYLASLPGVEAVHDLHIWPMSTTETALTAHLVLPWPSAPPGFLTEVTGELTRRFRIDHATLQLEPREFAERCAQARPGGL